MTTNESSLFVHKMNRSVDDKQTTAKSERKNDYFFFPSLPDDRRKCVDMCVYVYIHATLKNQTNLFFFYVHRNVTCLF
jgi:hypothetical protein